MLMSDTSALTLAGPIVLTDLRVVESSVVAAPGFLDVSPRSRYITIDLIVKIVVGSTVAVCILVVVSIARVLQPLGSTHHLSYIAQFRESDSS